MLGSQTHPPLSLLFRHTSCPQFFSRADLGSEIEWLRAEREVLLQTGVYRDDDPIVAQLTARIEELEAVVS